MRRLIRPLKPMGSISADDWWAVDGKTALAAYDPITSTDLADSLINRVNPGTYNGHMETADVALSNGWQFAGTNTCVKITGLFPSAIQSSIVCFRNYTNGNYAYGSYDGNRWHAGIISSNYIFADGGGSYILNPISGVDPVTLGMAGGDAYQHGINIGLITTGTLPVYSISIGAYSASETTHSNRIVADVAAFAAYSDVLTDAEMLALSDRMKAL